MLQRSGVQRPRTLRSREETRASNDQMLSLLGNIRTLEDQLIAEQYRHRLLLEENEQYRGSLHELDLHCKTQKKTISELEAETEVRRVKNEELESCEESLKDIYAQLDELTTAAEKRSSECQLISLERDQIKEENEVLIQSNLEARSRLQQFAVILTPYLGISENTDPLQVLQIVKTRLRVDRQELLRLQNTEVQMRKAHSAALHMERQLIIKMEYEQKLLLQREHDAEKMKELNNLNQSQDQLESIIEDMLLKEDELSEELGVAKGEYEQVRTVQEAELRAIEEQTEKETQEERAKLTELGREVDRLRAEIGKWEALITSKRSMCTQVMEEYEFKSKVDLNLDAMKRLRECQERNKHLRRKMIETREGIELVRQERALMAGEVYSVRMYESISE